MPTDIPASDLKKAAKKTCPYCGSSELIFNVSDFFEHRQQYTYTCQRCRLRFFFYKDSNYRKNGKTETQEPAANCSDEEELFRSAGELIRQKNSAQACIMLYEYPSPLRHPLTMLFYRLIGDIAYYGGISGTTAGELSLLAYNIRNCDYYLPQNDPRQLYEVLTSAYEALMLLNELHIEYYSYHFITLTRRYGPCKQVYKTRTDAWIRRAAAVGSLAQRLESLQNDALYGEKYREMSAALWAACSEYHIVSEHNDIIQYTSIINTLSNYFIVARPENRLRRQISAKLQDSGAAVDLDYRPVTRNKITILFLTALFCLFLFSAVIVLSLCIGNNLAGRIFDAACEWFWGLCGKNYRLINSGSFIVIVVGSVVYTFAFIFYTRKYYK